MLKAMQAYIGLCGLLDMRGPRDAFLTAVCRACLPPHYNLTVFSGVNNTCTTQQSTSSTQSASYTTSSTMYDDHHHQQYNTTSSNTYGSESPDYKQQQQVVVAVGTPLATPSSLLQALSSSSPGETFFTTLYLHL